MRNYGKQTVDSRPESGGDRGTRTPNLRDANAALSQLSYIPNVGIVAVPHTNGKAASRAVSILLYTSLR